MCLDNYLGSFPQILGPQEMKASHVPYMVHSETRHNPEISCVNIDLLTLHKVWKSSIEMEMKQDTGVWEK